jgi:hypothetical protein
MAEVKGSESLDDLTNGFLDECKRDTQERDHRAQRLARQLVVRMAMDEPFGIGTFLFAASLGQPNLYEKQKDTLSRASEVPRGSVVSVFDEDRLSIVGLAASPALVMHASLLSDRREQPDLESAQERSLIASLLMLNAVGYKGVTSSTALHNIWDARLEKGINGIAPYSTMLFWSYHEPQAHDMAGAPDLSKLRNLEVGPERTLKRVHDNQDEVGRLMVARLLEQLARLAVPSSVKSEAL